MGQRCTATSRAIVEKPIVEAFLDRLRARTEKLKIGDPRDPSTDIGPAIDGKQLDTTLDYLKVGQDDGAKLVYGGDRLSEGPHAHGFFSKPAIMTGVSSKSKLGQDEVFGPLLGIIEAKDFNDADSPKRTSLARPTASLKSFASMMPRSGPKTSS